MMLKKIIFFLVFFCFVFTSKSQLITNYTVADGLITDFIECIDIDINNNVWIGTSQGIQKFDGVNWLNYNTSNISQILSDNIKDIYCASNGDIWVGTDFGVNRYDGINWYSYTTINSDLISNQIKSIDEDLTSGLIWFGTNLGASSFDMSSWTSYSNNDLHWSGVSSVSFDNQGGIWFGHLYGGLTYYDGINFNKIDTSNGLLSQNVTDLRIDNLGNKWVGTGGGISILDNQNLISQNYTRMYILPPPDTLNPVVEIDIGSNGNVWVAIYVGYLAEGGVAYFDGVDWQDFDISDGLIGPNIRGIAIDIYNNAWVATSTGISKISLPISSTNNLFINPFAIFPNPSTGEYFFSSSVENSDISLYNSFGMKILTLNPNASKINLKKFSPGIYYVLFRNEEKTYRKKIIKM